MAGRQSRVAGVVAGCAVLVGIAAGPASAQMALSQPDGDRATVEGSAPQWAKPEAKVGTVDDGEQRRVTLALELRDPRGAHRLAQEVSNPESPQYRHHLSSEEFTRRFAATDQTVARVTDWLRSQGLHVDGVSPNKHFVEVTGDVGRLRSAFEVDLGRYRVTTRDGRTHVLAAPDRQVSLPRGLRGAVTAVLGLDDAAKTVTTQQLALRAPDGSRPRPGNELSTAATTDACATYWGEHNNTTAPQKHPAGRQSNWLCGYLAPQMRAIYGLTDADTGAGQTVAIVGAYNLPTIEADTNEAARRFGAPTLSPGQYSAVLPPTFTDHDQCGPDAWHGEQALDVQSVHEIAPAASIVYYGAQSCFDLNIALNTAVTENRASIISNSWLYPGESLVPAAERQQMGAIAIQAAIQGQAIVFCSGDQGDNSAVQGQPEATWPASHPWVTAVGGTTVALGGDNKVAFSTGWQSSGFTQSGNSWVAQNDRDGRFAGGAGGGASMYFAAPGYQQGLVPNSVSGGKRVMPDISALADPYTGIAIGYTVDGAFHESISGGTSLAAPLIAGLVADAQQRQGVQRFGFLNDALYALADRPQVADVEPVAAGLWTPFMVGFVDVDVPGELGSYLIDFDTKPQTLQTGAGWDPVTGIGTPAAGFTTALGS